MDFIRNRQLFGKQDKEISYRRIWEIDFVRGIALLLMIIFHFLFDLREFFGFNVAYNKGIYYLIGKTAGILFILISAVSCKLSQNNNKRAVKLLLVALLITIVSHIYDSSYGIKFGILHFLGISILLYPIFKELRSITLIILGTFIIAAGNYLGHTSVISNYMFIFNLTSSSWVSGDYYPFFPWFGVFLYGIAVSKVVYQERHSLLKDLPKSNIVTYLGRHTLAVYLVHQPVLIGLIYLYVQLKHFF